MGWVSTSGRYLGIVTCSALLLISATLGQSGQVSPPRSFAPPASAAIGGQTAQDTSPTPDATPEPEVASSNDPEATSAPSLGEPTPSIPTPTPPPATSDNLNDDSAFHPGNAEPNPGTGFYVPPQADIQFDKATPVRMSPVGIRIPAAWVDARVRSVGVTPDGQMEAPEDFWEVGWYRYGTRPGDPGKAVMAGHLDSQDGAAVFYFLGDLQSGDEIRILLGGPDGERIYHVREVATYNVNDAPLDRIFGPSDTSELVLITCGGEWRGADAGGYSDRIVVYADLALPGG